jgi:hypothetical protein
MPAERRKAASGAAEYFLPKKRNKKKSRRGKSRPDEYGFSVDPRVAKELRDSELQLASLTIGKRMRPYTFAQKARKLQARIKEIRQSLQCPCPSKYQLKHLQGDKERLEILAGRGAQPAPCSQRRKTRKRRTGWRQATESFCIRDADGQDIYYEGDRRMAWRTPDDRTHH